MRVVRSLVALSFFVIGVAAVAGALAMYLATSGHSAPMLRAVAGRLGQVVAGQRTEQIELQVRIRPVAQELTGVARLDVRAETDGRQRVYFLLNRGLRIDRVWEERGDGARVPLAHYRLSFVTVIELAHALRKGDAIRIGMEYCGNPRAGGLDGGGGVLEPDDVVLTASDFWYPADLQGFFHADVEISLPANLTLVHNGREVSRVALGDSRRVRWSAPRRVQGLALVAGRFRSWSEESAGSRYQVLIADGVTLDGRRVLDSVITAAQDLTAYYGPSGFPQVTVFVDRSVRRAFNDGGGLIGIAPRYFRRGDYGFAIIAHEVAHNWWGGTVAERWLQPGTGGEWIVEGFAEFSSWWAVRKHFGEAALLRHLAERFYNPNTAGTLASMSAIDNAIDPSARETIYNKGGYVAFMLQQRLGEEGFGAAARQLLDHFRYQSVTDKDVEVTFAAMSGQDLGEFFSAWVRSDASTDLSLDPQDAGAAARDHRTGPAPGKIDLWRFPPNAEPERQITSLDAKTPVGNAESLVLDPLALVADMYRSNNVLPRYDNPRSVARSARDDLMVVYGEPYPWAPATVTHQDAGGQTVHSWAFDRGLLTSPAWSAEGTRILVAETPRGGQPDLVALNVTDGSRQRLGQETVAAGTADGTVIARGSRLVLAAGGGETTIAEHPGARISAPLGSPDGKTVAYAVVAGLDMELRAIDADGANGRLLFTWPSAAVRWCWSPDSAHLFAVLPGDWDWQVWELPRDGGAPRLLVREASTIDDLAVAPNGTQIAIVAEARLDYGSARREVFRIDRDSGDVERFNLGGRNARSLAWLDADSLLVVASDPTYPVLPTRQELHRLRLSDGSLLSFP